MSWSKEGRGGAEWQTRRKVKGRQQNMREIKIKKDKRRGKDKRVKRSVKGFSRLD